MNRIEHAYTASIWVLALVDSQHVSFFLVRSRCTFCSSLAIMTCCIQAVSTWQTQLGDFLAGIGFQKHQQAWGGLFFFAREELNKHTCHSDWCFRMFQLSVCNVCRDSTVTGSEPYALESLCLNSSAGTSLLSIQGANLREYLKGVESFKLIRQEQKFATFFYSSALFSWRKSHGIQQSSRLSLERLQQVKVFLIFKSHRSISLVLFFEPYSTAFTGFMAQPEAFRIVQIDLLGHGGMAEF